MCADFFKEINRNYAAPSFTAIHAYDLHYNIFGVAQRKGEVS